MDKNHVNVLKGYNLLLYFAGSMIINIPTEECVIDFWLNGRLKKLPVTSSNPRFLKAAAFLRGSCEDKDLCRKNLSEDYYRLFDPDGLPLAPPFQGDWPKVQANSTNHMAGNQAITSQLLMITLASNSFSLPPWLTKACILTMIPAAGK
jgi:hypothetical protein